MLRFGIAQGMPAAEAASAAALSHASSKDLAKGLSMARIKDNRKRDSSFLIMVLGETPNLTKQEESDLIVFIEGLPTTFESPGYKVCEAFMLCLVRLGKQDDVKKKEDSGDEGESR
eukprot:7478377-Lingulodinium_polyedra.AAC.1